MDANLPHQDVTRTATTGRTFVTSINHIPMNTSSQPTEKLHFTTTGITCGGCANSVRTILGRMAGVVHVAVDVEKGTADVEIERGSLSVDQLNKALEPAGYGLKPFQA